MKLTNLVGRKEKKSDPAFYLAVLSMALQY